MCVGHKHTHTYTYASMHNIRIVKQRLLEAFDGGAVFIKRTCAALVTPFLTACSPKPRKVGLARTIHIRCKYVIFGREVIKYTVIYGVYIRFWPTLQKRHLRTYRPVLCINTSISPVSQLLSFFSSISTYEWNQANPTTKTLACVCMCISVCFCT